MRDWFIHKLGGFTAKEYEAQIPTGRAALAEIVKDHFNGVNEDDILKSEVTVVKDKNGRPQQKQVWYHKGRRIDGGEVESLVREAQEFYDSNFFKIMKNELEYHAMRQQMINKATHPDHLIEGKMLIYLWDVVETRIKKFIQVK